MGQTNEDSPAVILDCFDHGESDLIVTFFSKNSGRLTGIAKGAKRSKRRFVNKLELFSLLTLNYKESRGRSLVFINEAELHNSFLNLRHDIHLYNAASVICEYLLMATGEREKDHRIFSLLLWSLTSLDEKRPHLPVLVSFLLLMIDYIGYRPDFSACHSCDKHLSSDRRYHFVSMSGYMVCSLCKQTISSPCIPLSLGTIKFFNSILEQPLSRLHRLHFSPLALQQALTVLHDYSQHLFQKEIHSWKAALSP